MAEIFCGILSERETSTPCEPSTRASRRRRLEFRQIKVVNGAGMEGTETEHKRHKLELDALPPSSFSRNCDNAVEFIAPEGEKTCEDRDVQLERIEAEENHISSDFACSSIAQAPDVSNDLPKFGIASVCGRRRDMEDAVAIRPSFCCEKNDGHKKLHYFGVYDGHGCSHVAIRCRERLHELVKEELERDEVSMEWKNAMERSFSRMDQEIIAWNQSMSGANCRCELQSPQCDTVGSTAVVSIVTLDKIVVSNCGDSRAVLCRNGKPVPLSSDHKPDRPDELLRIQSAGGRVIYWDGPRVLGVLAMSRAIGDNYLKPYVSCLPEVTIRERSNDDDCLILASDGLWDVVSNETACSVARMCLRGRSSANGDRPPEIVVAGTGDICDKPCSDASMLLTKLALARHSTDNVSVVVVDLRKPT